MDISIKRLAPLALGALVLLAGNSAPASASSDLSREEAENRVVALLNQQRAAVGLLPLRRDWRLRNVARVRSYDMATKDYFSHTHSDGRSFWDLLNARDITWYGAGEILAWNTWGSLADSAAGAAKQWRNSTGHYALVVKPDYNYIGIGLSIDPDSGKKIWTGILMRGPDRTGAVAKLGTHSLSRTTSSTYRATVRWAGYDPRLQVLTAGLRDYQIQRRVNGGSWTTQVAATTATSLTTSLSRGNRYEFRVRARDRAGNYGYFNGVATFTP